MVEQRCQPLVGFSGRQPAATDRPLCAALSSVEISRPAGHGDRERRRPHGSDRSPQEVFGHHAQALGAEDLDDIVADYSDEAVLITRIEDSIDTFVFRDGLIRVQTVRYTLQPAR
jgi:hypothetical protein